MLNIVFICFSIIQLLDLLCVAERYRCYEAKDDHADPGTEIFVQFCFGIPKIIVQSAQETGKINEAG